MTFYQGLATVLLRVWATLTFVSGLQGLGVRAFGTFLVLTSTSETDAYIWLMEAYYSASIGVAILIWIFAGALARRISPGEAIAGRAPPVIDAALLSAIGAFLVGLYVLTRSLSDTLVHTYTVMSQRNSETALAGAPIMRPHEFLQLLGQWLAIFIAFALIVISPRLGKLFSWLRSAGQYQEKSTPRKTVDGE